MPIAKHLRRFYRGPDWRAARQRILTRAGGRFNEARYLGGAKCEQCGRPDRKRVWVVRREVLVGVRIVIDQLWSLVKGDGQRWRSSFEGGAIVRFRLSGREWKRARQVPAQIGVAHLNGIAGDDRDENLKALCRRCHLMHDREQHRMTRSTRKDRSRPLLQEAS